MRKYRPLADGLMLISNTDDMHASNDTGHHDAGYSYDTGQQNVYKSFSQAVDMSCTFYFDI